MVERRRRSDGRRQFGIPIVRSHLADSLPLVLPHLTQLTVFWEFSYCVLVWPRLTRPLVLAIAIGMHLGIGMFLGMWTFGLAMIIANLSFVSPWVVRRIVDRQQTSNGIGQGRGAANDPQALGKATPGNRLSTARKAAGQASLTPTRK